MSNASHPQPLPGGECPIPFFLASQFPMPLTIKPALYSTGFIVNGATSVAADGASYKGPKPTVLA